MVRNTYLRCVFRTRNVFSFLRNVGNAARLLS